jgi:hypothetical protein
MMHWVHTVREEAGDGWRWRIIESDGSPCRRWLPSETLESLPLDRGGFEDYADALNFGLGVCWIRASEGWLGQFRTADVDRARRAVEARPSGSAKGVPLYRWVVPA